MSEKNPVAESKKKKGSARVHSGGSWNYGAVFARVALRGGRDPVYRIDFRGFRIARTKK